MSFFNLQIFAFSDQIYMSSKKIQKLKKKRKNRLFLLVTQLKAGLQQKLVNLTQPVQVQLKQR